MISVYCLRIRPTDKEKWGEAEYFKTRKKRNETGTYTRIILGYRTHSFEEKKTREEVNALFS